MRNRDGKAVIIVMIALVALILAAALPWYFIISRNVLDAESLGRTTVPDEQAGENIITLPEEPQLEYEPEEEEEPTPEPEPENVLHIPLDDIVYDIGAISPDLYRSLPIGSPFREEPKLVQTASY